MKLPTLHDPQMVADHFGVTKEWLLTKAKEAGACHKVGREYKLTDSDIDRIMEAMRCPIPSANVSRAGTGPTVSPFGDEDFEAALDRQKKRKQRQRAQGR